MTEKRALEKTIEMWEKLEELYKEYSYYSIPALKDIYFVNILKINPLNNIPLNNCYLCEYSKDTEYTEYAEYIECIEDTECIKCPVKNWSIYGKEDKNCKHCTDYNSVYRMGITKHKINNVLKLLKETYNDLYNN